MAATTQWLSTEEAARRLGVKPATLYAYVSRGLVPSFTAPGERASRFDRADIEGLLTRRRSHPGGSAETVLATRITRLSEDGVRYRGQPIEALARTRPFEEVAALLWDVADAGVPWPVVELRLPLLPAEATLADRLRVAIAVAATADAHRHDVRPESVVVSARQLIASVVDSLPATSAPTRTLTLGRRRIRGSIAASLTARLGAPKVTPALVRAVNSALVLLADHELATSTYAARVAASTRADVYSAVLAGAASGGPLHSGASREVAQLFEDASQRGAGAAVADVLRSGRKVPGFGHKIYQRDPRFPVLYATARSSAIAARRVTLVDDVLAFTRERVPVEPNIDFAGAALAFCAGMRSDAAEAIFLVARMAGWVAHVMEEYDEPPLRFRTRGLYVGEVSRGNQRAAGRRSSDVLRPST